MTQVTDPLLPIRRRTGGVDEPIDLHNRQSPSCRTGERKWSLDWFGHSETPWDGPPVLAPWRSKPGSIPALPGLASGPRVRVAARSTGRPTTPWPKADGTPGSGSRQHRGLDQRSQTRARGEAFSHGTSFSFPPRIVSQVNPYQPDTGPETVWLSYAARHATKCLSLCCALRRQRKNLSPCRRVRIPS